MPELPEVEAGRHLVERFCVGSIIKSVCAVEQGAGPRHGLFDDIVHDGHDEKRFIAALKDRTLLAAKRRGKQLWFEVASANGAEPGTVLVHFGMTGCFVVKGVASPGYKSFKVQDEVWPPKFCKFELHFANGAQLAFCDARRIGRVRLRGPQPEKEGPLNKLARDPLIDGVDLPSFADYLSKTSTNIKTTLLDQERICCGIGNWIADEVLYQSQIHPSSLYNALPTEKVKHLASAIEYICTKAAECTTSNVSFPDSWLFHFRWEKGRKGVAAKDVNGLAITFSTVGGRTSAIVSGCQKLYRQPVIAASASAPGGEDTKKKSRDEGAEAGKKRRAPAGPSGRRSAASKKGRTGKISEDRQSSIS
eukprot:GSChrysophyteH1.ASY1.ANO1.210.1 assembled CDS